MTFGPNIMKFGLNVMKLGSDVMKVELNMMTFGPKIMTFGLNFMKFSPNPHEIWLKRTFRPSIPCRRGLSRRPNFPTAPRCRATEPLDPSEFAAVPCREAAGRRVVAGGRLNR